MDKTMENFLVATTPGGIEAQEKQGQIEQSFKETMPKNLRPSRQAFEAVGFIFHDDADDLFVNATFPKGWRKSPTDHSMWTKIVDAEGKEVAAIFYKAAFYDRSAFASLLV